MSEPIPPSVDLDEELVAARAALRTLKRFRPRSDDESRAQAAEAIRLRKLLLAASRQTVADVKRFAEPSSNGHALAPAKPAGGKHVLTTAHLGALARSIAGHVREELAPLAARIAALEATALTDGGAWKKEVLYQPNQVVTSDGTLWVCRQPNSNAKPPGDCWRQLHRTLGRK